MYITANHYCTPIGANNQVIKYSATSNTTNCNCGKSQYLQILRGCDGTPGRDGRDVRDGKDGRCGQSWPKTVDMIRGTMIHWSPW